MKTLQRSPTPETVGDFRLLEPDAGKLARPVLRGGTRREACSLPDFIRGFDSHHPLQLYKLML